MNTIISSNEDFLQLKELCAQLNEQKNAIYSRYDRLVAKIISGEIRDQDEIEKVMDGLMDFGDDDRFLDLYKKLGRFVYNINPQLVGEHIMLFRLLHEE